MIYETSHNIDFFAIQQRPDSTWKIACQGWFVAKAGAQHVPMEEIKISLQVPSAPDCINIDRKALVSNDLVAHFGEKAGNSRFEFEVSITDPDLPYSSSRLLFELSEGYEVAIRVGLNLQGRILSEEERRAEIALVRQFESLGNNCEFGWVQRMVGFERLGLLRWVGSFSNRQLASLIRSGFAGFGNPEDLEFSFLGTEWMATSRRYGLYLHTWKHADKVPNEALIREMFSTSVKYLSEMMLELIREGSRIFIRRIRSHDDRGDLDELFSALRSQGPASLLVVTDADEQHPHGTVERSCEGFYRAWHNSLVDTGALPHVRKEPWLGLLAEASALIRKDRLGQRPVTHAHSGRRDWSPEPSLRRLDQTVR